MPYPGLAEGRRFSQGRSRAHRRSRRGQRQSGKLRRQARSGHSQRADFPCRTVDPGVNEARRPQGVTSPGSGILWRHTATAARAGERVTARQRQRTFSMSNWKKAGLIGLGAMLGLLLSLNFSAIAQRDVRTPIPYEDLQLLSAVFGKIKSDYVEPVHHPVDRFLDQLVVG